MTSSIKKYSTIAAYSGLLLLTLLVSFNILNLVGQTDVPWMWYATRASGITSYLLLFLLIITGTGISSGYIFNLFGPIVSWRIHRTIGITLVAFIIIHIVTLSLDPFMNFTLSDIFIPFHSQYNPLYLSLGIIGFYLFLLTIATSIFIIVSKYKAWRFIHYITYPTFIALFIHGAFIGTDSKASAMQLVYWITGILFILSVIYRIVKSPSRKSRKQILNGMRI